MEILAEDLYHIASPKSFKEISQITKNWEKRYIFLETDFLHTGIYKNS